MLKISVVFNDLSLVDYLSMSCVVELLYLNGIVLQSYFQHHQRSVLNNRKIMSGMVLFDCGAVTY